MSSITLNEIKEVYVELYNHLRFGLGLRKLKTKEPIASEKDDFEVLVGYNGIHLFTREEMADYFMRAVTLNTENKIIKERVNEFHDDLIKDGCIKLYIDKEENGVMKRTGFILRQTKPNAALLNRGVDIPDTWSLDFYKKYPYDYKKNNDIHIAK
jgi:hypothetical protein